MEPKPLKHVSRIRRLFFDIETSPNVVLCWRTGYNLTITPDNIIKERAIICIAYKWENDNEVHSLNWDAHQDDKAMLQKFAKIVAQCDEMVFHNGDRFDLPWIRTRCLYHRIQAIPDRTTVDTLKIAKARFNFNSNKLAYIAKYLGLPTKIQTEYNLWKGIVLDKNKKCMRDMVTYCKQDVRVLENVYKELARLAPAKTHAGVLSGLDAWTCPNCVSDQVYQSKVRFTAKGGKQHQMQCKTCCSYYQISHKVFQDYQEVMIDKKSKGL